MKLLSLFVFLLASPGCLSQCVNCAPPSYQSPCCVPTSNVQTIQTARAFTNGAQGSQVIMYYNGQRVVAGQQPQAQPGTYTNQNPANNYQNPGPIPTYQNQNVYGNDNSGNQNYPTTGSPSDQYGNVAVGGVVAGGPVVGGIGNQQNGASEVGGNVQNQNGNNQQYQQDPYTTGGNVGYQPSTQGPNINYQGDNVNQQQYDNQASTLSPAAGEVSYQPFVPAGNNDYSNNGNNVQQQQQQQYQGNGNGAYNNQQGNNVPQQQQGQQQQYSNNNQNTQNVIYPSGGVVAGGAIGGSSSYNSPNTGYVNSAVQPQTYPTQVVAGGAVSNQNVQQQPDVNTQYQDQLNNPNNVNGGNNNQINQQTMNTNSPYNQQGPPNGYGGQNQQQQQQNVNGQYQQNPGSSQTGSGVYPLGQQGTTNDYGTSQGMYSTGQGSVYSTTPNYQQQDQQQFTSPQPGQQSGFNGQQGFTTVSNLPTDTQNELTDATDSFSTSTLQPDFLTTTLSTPLAPQPTAPSSVIVNNGVPITLQETTGSTVTVPTTPSPFNDSPALEQTSVSSNQEEFRTSTPAPIYSQPDQTNFSPSTTTLEPSPVVPIIPIVPTTMQNNETVSETPTSETQNDNLVTAYTSTQGPYYAGNNVQGSGSTNSFQSTTQPTFNNNNNNNNNGMNNGGQQTSSPSSIQTTTGAINGNVYNDNQSGLTFSSTANPNMPQAQYPSQQEILASTGQTTNAGVSGISTQSPQFPSQTELGATSASTQPTPAPQFPAQGDLGATTISSVSQNSIAPNQQSTTGVSAQFPSQQELLQRDQQNSGGATINDAAFTPQYNDMNTQYGHYSSSTASSGVQFDQPASESSQQPQNSAGFQNNVLISVFVLILYGFY